MKQILSILILTLLCQQALLAQKKKKQQELPQTAETPAAPEFVEARLKLIAKGYNNKIVLRWAIDNTTAWPFLQQSGVNVDMVELDEKNQPLGTDWKRINNAPVKPWPAAQFKNYAGLENDDNMLIAAQALYGNHEATIKNDTDLQGIQEADMAYNNIVLLAMMAADFSPKTADALGLRYEHILPVNKTHKYAYRIYPAQEHPVFKIDTGFYMYAGFLKDEPLAPIHVEARGKDGNIEIFWPKNKLYNNFSSYNIERSEDGKNFKKINVNPVVFNNMDTLQKDFVYADSVKNYKRYYYRVHGIDAFGDTSYYCPTVSATATNQISPAAVFLSATLSPQKDEVQLKWEYQLNEQRPLKGFVIRRGRTSTELNEAAHEKILPANTTVFKDKPGKLEKGVYYQVIALDTSGNYSLSNIPYVFAFDTIPPKPPTGFKGHIDTSGLVHLNWDRDVEDNVYAYRLFVSNNPSASFSPVNSALIENINFIDTIGKTLTNRKIYYKLVALDGNNNHSEATEILTLIRPKFAPSPAPVIGDFKVTNRGVTFNYSHYEDPEITDILIYRKEITGNNWILIDSTIPTRNSYSDSLVESGKRYQYMLRTKDIFNMLSPESFPLEVYIYKESKEPEDIHFTSVLKADNAITLNWVTTKDLVDYYIIYKDMGAGFLQYKSLPANETSFSENIKMRTRYAIKAVYKEDVRQQLVEGNWLEAVSK